MGLVKAIRPDARIQSSTLSVKLYTPRQAFFLSFFTGWPSGLVLASINWIRMRQTTTAVIHLTVGLFLLIGWGFLLDSFPTGAFVLLTLAMHLGIIFYLYQQMKLTIERFAREGNGIQTAAWRSGCLTSLAATIVFLMLLVLISFILLAGQ
jgi:hypothetical protein